MTTLPNSHSKAADSERGTALNSERPHSDADSDSAALREEVGELGQLFGAVIARFAGQASFDVVENIRGLAAELRSGNPSSGQQ